jgi:hypothetical protein
VDFKKIVGELEEVVKGRSCIIYLNDILPLIKQRIKRRT